MMKFYSMSSGEKFDGLDEDITLVLNSASPVVRKLGERADDAGESFSEELEAAAKRIYMLALMAQRRLTPDELRDFLADSYRQLEKSLS